MSQTQANTYDILFKAWKEELLSKSLLSLNLNFIKNNLQFLEIIKGNFQNEKFVTDVFIKRAEFLIQNLIELRKNKILISFLDNEKIISSYLSKQELYYYDYLKNSEQIIQNKQISFSDQTKEFLLQNSNIMKDSMNDQEFKKSIEKTEIEHSTNNINEEVMVVFLKDIDSFVNLDNRVFGPYKKNDAVKIPKDIFTKILQPKNIAQLKLE